MKLIPNIDTLEFTLNYRDYNKIIGSLYPMLDPARDDSQQNKVNSKIDLNGQSFELLGHGNAFYYYLLHNDNMEIRFVREHDVMNDHYPIYCKLKSVYLWQYGYQQAYTLALDYLTNIFGLLLDTKISRLDLAIHCNQHIEIDMQQGVVCRAKHNNVWSDSAAITGYQIGKSPIMLRIYNKGKEITASSGKTWFYQIWQSAGFDLSEEVWNVEFQLRREFFKERGLSSVDDAFTALPILYQYLTRDWVRVVNDDNPVPSRRSTACWWQQVQTALSDVVYANTLDKQQMLRTNSEHLLKSAMGYLVSIAAIENLTTPEDLLEYLRHALVMRYVDDEHKKSSFPDVVQERRAVLCLSH